MLKQIISPALFARIPLSRLCILITALVLTGGLTASALAWLAPAFKARPAVEVAKADTITPAPAVPQEESVQAIVVTVRPAWLEPSELTLPEGKYLLVVQNRSGQRDVTFRLDSDGGTRLLEVHETQRPDWRRRLNLSPGGYTLTEAAHPDWVCRLNITPR